MNHLLRTVLGLLLPLVAMSAADDAQPLHVLVITPTSFTPALADWRAHRAAQGYTVTVRAPTDDLPTLVRAEHQRTKGALRFVLLLGDARQVPCAYIKGAIIAKHTRDANIAHDNALADLDGDGLPELAVGRVPADTVKEARAMLARSLAYEKDTDHSTWRRRINVIAGVGGFGKFADWALERVATKFLTENVPDAFDLHVTYANPSSPFCPPPATVMNTTLQRFNEGSLIVAYLGHGSRRALDRVSFADRKYSILDEDGAYELKTERGPPIAIFVACSTGHFDTGPDCLAEVAVKQPAGPIAAIASSRLSMPYANAVLAKELLDAVLVQKIPTLGGALAHAKRRMVADRPNDAGRRMIEMLAMGYQVNPGKRKQERLEHVYLYNLLGDPTLRLRMPETIELTAPTTAAAGGSVKVAFPMPATATGVVELVAARTANRPARGGDTAAHFQQAYERANNRTVARVPLKAGAAGVRSVLVTIPATAPHGKYFLRVYLHGAGGYASGSFPLQLKKANS